MSIKHSLYDTALMHIWIAGGLINATVAMYNKIQLKFYNSAFSNQDNYWENISVVFISGVLVRLVSIYLILYTNIIMAIE